MSQFPHHNIDLRELNHRLGTELGMEPMLITQMQDLIDLVLTSIPDPENIIVSDPVTDEPIGRYVFIPLNSTTKP